MKTNLGPRTISRVALGGTVLAAFAAASPAAFAQCDQFDLVSHTYPATSEPLAIAAGDVDGDFDLDLVLVDASAGGLGVMLGDGNGTFGAASVFDAGISPLDVALGDLDGDGDFDAAVANQGWYDYGAQLWRDFGLTVLVNADGDFGTSFFVPMPSDEVEPQALALGDLDGDHDLDIALAIGYSGYLQSDIAVLANLGSGRFGPPAFYATGYDPVAVRIADADGDGALDLMTVNHYGYSLSVLLGAGNGTFGAAQSYPTGQYPRDLALGDIDGDGDLDAAVPERYGIRILENAGDGSFGWAGGYDAGLRPHAAAFADLDGDGDQDLTAVDVLGDRMFTWTNDGNGTFALREARFIGNGPTDLAATDVDDDGDPDLAVTNATDGEIAVLRNECPIGTYCVGKENSQGCVPEIAWTGAPSLSGADDFFILAANELNHRLGLLFFGPTAASTPFAGGTLCVGKPFVRTPPQGSGGNPGSDDCSGTFSFHVSIAWMREHSWAPGAEFFAQYLSRDPAHPDGTGLALTNALRFTIQP